MSKNCLNLLALRLRSLDLHSVAPLRAAGRMKRVYVYTCVPLYLSTYPNKKTQSGGRHASRPAPRTGRLVRVYLRGWESPCRWRVCLM